MASKKKTGSKKQTAFGKRLREAMQMRGHRGEPLAEADLVRRIHELAAGPEHEALRNKSLTQQMVNHVLNGEAERSYFTPFLAAALGVSALWLGWGVGRHSDLHVQFDDDDGTEVSVPRGRRLANSKS